MYGSTFLKYTAFLTALALVGLIAWFLKNKPDYFPLASIETGTIVAILERLGIFVVLALFVERATEVYVAVFLEPYQPKANFVGPLAETAMDGEATKFRATIFSLVLGLFIGLAGVSILGALLPTDFKMGVVLRLADIVLVGALLSGGAEPIHQIMEAISESAAAVKKRAKAQKAAATV